MKLVIFLENEETLRSILRSTSIFDGYKIEVESKHENASQIRISLGDNLDLAWFLVELSRYWLSRGVKEICFYGVEAEENDSIESLVAVINLLFVMRRRVEVEIVQAVRKLKQTRKTKTFARAEFREIRSYLEKSILKVD